MSEKFEQHLESLEEAVKQLESGELALDTQLSIYEKALLHLKACHDLLSKAEARVKILVENESGEIEERPFDAPGAE